MSLVKYYSEKEGNGRGSVWWGRAERDGLPFRGRSVPNYTESEFEERLVVVGDANVELFDVTTDGEERKRYLKVVDRIVNGHFTCLHREHHFVDGKMLVYIEWVERYMEDKNPNEHDAINSHIQPAEPGEQQRKSITVQKSPDSRR